MTASRPPDPRSRAVPATDGPADGPATGPSTAPRPRRRWRVVGGLGVPILALVMVVAGCSSDGVAPSAVELDAAQGSAQGAAQGAAAAAAAPGAERQDQAAPSKAAGGSGTSSGSAAGARQRLVRTAQLTIQVDGSLAVAAAEVRQAARDLDGVVESETTGFTDGAEPALQPAAEGDAAPSGHSVSRGESLLVLRIPEPKLDDAVARVARVPGHVVSQTAASQDVTGDVADLTSRVASQRVSLERVRALMSRATSLQDVVSLESELARRESELEALQARLASLNDRADLATLTVLLRLPSAPARPPADSDSGFLAGLRAGWEAVQASTTVVLTVLGAILPFAVVVVVFGGPAWLLIRRRRARVAGAARAASAAGAADGTPAPAPATAPAP